MIANFGELLADDWLDDLIDGSRFGVENFRRDAEFLVLHVERKRGVLQYCLAFEYDVVAKMIGGANADFDAAVGRAQIVAGL